MIAKIMDASAVVRYIKKEAIAGLDVVEANDDGNMYWLCVLSPNESTFQRLKPLLVEAHQFSAARHPSNGQSKQSE
jgi:hypothetical protein